MTHDHEHHEHNHAHASDRPEPRSGVTFDFDGTHYTVSLEAAKNAGLIGNADRIQLPGGQLVLLHPHAHADNANTAQSIQERGGNVWPVDEAED